MWAADQGAIAKHSGLDRDTGVPLARQRVAAFVGQAAKAPQHLLVPERGADFIEFLVAGVPAPDDDAAAAVDNEIRMVLETLIESYCLSVIQGLVTPVSPSADIDYLCQWEIRDTTPPEWARDYFTQEPPGDVPAHTYFERSPNAESEPAAVRHNNGQLRLTVDGEVFEVRPRRGVPGQYDFDWVSGPNVQYGFTSARSDGNAETKEALEEAVRDFLAMIDPETGYTSDDEGDSARDPSRPPLGWPPRS